MVPKDGPGTAVHSCCACWWAGPLTTASEEDTPPCEDITTTRSPQLAQSAGDITATHYGKSHIGELAPMALCDIHVAGCGEHLGSS